LYLSFCQVWAESAFISDLTEGRGHKYNDAKGCKGRFTVNQIFQFYHEFDIYV